VIAEDINLTNPGDLLRCNLLHAQTHARENKRGTPVYAHPQASIENSVIGSNVTITHPISITDSVIFDHTVVTMNSRLDRVIMTPDLFVDCRYFVDGGNAAPARSRAANA
jgi:NDP-sugar pyrophosphorylase family protein